jgi:YD repeat-containing protein
MLTATDPLGHTYTYDYDSQNNLAQTTDPENNISSNHYDKQSNNIESIDNYTQSRASRYFENGNIMYDTTLMSAAANSLPNPGFERQGESWNITAGNVDFTAAGRTGNRSARVTDPAGKTTVLSSAAFSVTENQNYILSGYFKTENLDANAASLVVSYNRSEGDPVEIKSVPLGGTQDWTRLHMVIASEDIPQNTTSFNVGFTVEPASGTVWFDDIQLEAGSILSAYNSVENSGMERFTGNLPNQWLGLNLSSQTDKVDTFSFSGDRSFKIVGAPGVNKALYQNIPLSGDQSTKLTLSGWSFADNPNPSGGWYVLQLRIDNADGTTDWSFSNDFSRTPKTEWEHVVVEVNPIKPFNSVGVYVYFYNQTGNAWFDDIRLEAGNNIISYGYDSGHNYLTSVKDPLGNMALFEYDLVGNRTKVTDPNGNSTNFAYDNLNRLSTVTDADSKVTSYGYDANGNRITVTDARSSTTTYGYNRFNQVESITDPLNKTASFSYDYTGLLTGIQYPNSSSLGFTYDSLSRLEAILMDKHPALHLRLRRQRQPYPNDRRYLSRDHQLHLRRRLQPYPNHIL